MILTIILYNYCHFVERCLNIMAIVLFNIVTKQPEKAMEMLTISKDEAEERVKAVECEVQKPLDESIELTFPATAENHSELNNFKIRTQLDTYAWIDRLSASKRHVLYART